VQETRDDGDRSTPAWPTSGAERLLETPEGVATVNCETVTDKGTIEWCQAAIEVAYFTHQGALLLLQGAQLSKFFPYWLLLKAEVTPIYDPRLRINKAVLAFVWSAPEELTVDEIKGALLQEVLSVPKVDTEDVRL
jgi:hypothetical protein